jgi:hypothetical protein
MRHEAVGSERRALKLRGKLRALKLRVIERRTLKLRLNERRALKLRLKESRALKLRPNERRPFKVREYQRRALKMSASEVNSRQAGEIETSALQTATAGAKNKVTPIRCLRIINVKLFENAESDEDERVGEGEQAMTRDDVERRVENPIVQRDLFRRPDPIPK